MHGRTPKPITCRGVIWCYEQPTGSVDRKWLEEYNQVISCFGAGAATTLQYRLMTPELLCIRVVIISKIQDTSALVPDGAAKASALWVGLGVGVERTYLNILLLMNAGDK
jgi:hypothetical protein